MGAVNPVGQLHGSPTALISPYLAWDRYYTYSYFKKGCRKNVHATIPKGNMGYDRTLFLTTLAVKPTFVAFL